jgi:regulator of protease activity HflC (stomatin/prohibitin superfamily)
MRIGKFYWFAAEYLARPNACSMAGQLLRLHVTIRGTAMPEDSRSSRDKVRLYRERLRAQGLRPVQIWVPDVRARSFISAARKQSKAVAASQDAKADQGFIDAVSKDIAK